MTTTDHPGDPARPATADAPSPGQPTDEEPLDDDPLDEDLVDADWDRPRRTNRLTWVLLAAVVAVLAFGGGVLVQKSHDSALVGGSARAFGGAGAAAGQGAPSGQGGAAGAQGRTGQAAASGSGGGAAGTPVVVGTITSASGDSLVVTDFGGHDVTVHVPTTATVTTPGLGGPATGSSVSVTGTRAADGTVTAETVTVRAS